MSPDYHHLKMRLYLIRVIDKLSCLLSPVVPDNARLQHFGEVIVNERDRNRISLVASSIVYWFLTLPCNEFRR